LGGGDAALGEALGEQFLDLVGALEPGLAEVRIEHLLFGIKSIEPEREKVAVAACEGDSRKVFAVVDDVGAAGREVFEVAEAFVQRSGRWRRPSRRRLRLSG